MEFTENQIYFFEKAFSSALNKDEKLDFDEMLKDTSFANAYNDFVNIQKSIQENGRANIKSNLKLIESKISEPKKSKHKIVKVLTVVLLLSTIVLTIYLSFYRSTIDTEKIYYAYYSKYPNTIDPLTKGDIKNITAFQLYEQKSYAKAIQKFKTYNSSDTTEFYIALSHLGNNNLEMCVPIFKGIIHNSKFNDSSIFKLDAEWYLALSYLKGNDIKSAIPLLKELQDSNHSFYASRAKNILKEIN